MQDESSTEAPVAARRRPRIALMGEFSAGKSTLTNLLIGDSRIPMRVTATQLPPVWLSHGTEAPYREDLKGERHPIEGGTLEGIPVKDTAFIRLFAEAEVLEVCDIIDTPGISDPNMPAEVWQRAAAEADGVLWLTHANQAWRQSEAAVWSEMPPELWQASLLLVTRIDKILSTHDRNRVISRIQREAGSMFREVLPISLTQALAAGEDDADLWVASGGEAFSAALLELIQDLERRVRMGRTTPASFMAPMGRTEVERPAGPRVRTIRVDAPAPTPEPTSDPSAELARIAAEAAGPAPQRVKLRVISTEPAPAPNQAAGPAPRRITRPVGSATQRPQSSQN